MREKQKLLLVLKKYQKYSILLTLLLAVGFCINAQEYDYVEGNDPTEKEIVEIIEEEKEEHGIDPNKMESMLGDLKKYSPEEFKQIESGTLSKEEATALMQNAFLNLPPEIQKKHASGLKTGSSKNIEAQVNKNLKSFRKVPYATAYKAIKQKMNKSRLAVLYNRIPKSAEFATKFLQDKEAPKQFFSIAKDKKRLVMFATCTVGLFIFGFILKRKRKAKNLSFGESFTKGIFHFFIFNGLKLLLVYLFFGNELAPTLRVIKSTYF